MLIPKVEQRIEQYLGFLEMNAYRKIADLKFEMYEDEPAAEAESWGSPHKRTWHSPPDNVKWKKIKAPAHWGKEWACCWFRTTYDAPKSGAPLFISVTPNADSLAYIDGKPAGAFNMYHNKLRVDADGKKHTLDIEAYSGHFYGGCGPLEGPSVVISAGKTIPDFPNTFSGGCLLERCHAVHSLFYDIRALYETAKIADANSLRKAKILKGLSHALEGISLNAEGDELEKQAASAERAIAPLLALKNGPTAPEVHLIGHAHIDHAWLWPIAETERKIARTYANMICFINEYPEFIFLQSQPCQLEMLKINYPNIFMEVKEAYKNGNWEPNGGMWVEADCNIPSGESLVRQFLVGKKVNKELLGYEADTLWLPDVFGCSAALPQIMAGCRIKYFVTSKLNWNDTTRFPCETFIWRGLDGTGIKTHFLSTFGPGEGYNGRVVPEELAAVWNSVQHKEVQSACLKSIGEGDGGGGTLRADLEMARRLGDLEGAPRATWKTVSAALNEIFAVGEFPEWRGELYLELHRGTYTTQSRTKRNNRLLEFALRRVELFSSLAALEGKGDYPRETLLDCWKRVLTFQFHDIIPGSCIGRVYKEAEADSAKMLAALAQIGDKAKNSLLGTANSEASKDKAVFVFNDLSWERQTEVSISEDVAGKAAAMKGDDCSVYPLQRYVDYNGNQRQVFFPKTPSLGWTRLTALNEIDEASSPFSWNDNVLETPFYIITIDAAGRITSLIDKRQSREMVAPGGAFNALITAEDVPVFWDAWDIDADWTKRIRQETQLALTGVAANGPACFRLRCAYEIGETSRLVQDMVCYAGDPRIDFVTKVSWREKRRLLKAEFDTVIDAAQVRCEVQYGHIMRNTHRNLMQDRAQFEICAHKWISLEEEGGGIALLNNCKYGHDVEGGRMRLTLLRSPVAPDPEADRGEHYFTYSILPFAGAFGNSGVVRSAYELNSPAEAMYVPASQNDGANNQSAQSFCVVDGNQVIIESVKAPEDGTHGELILRLYESLGGRANTTLHFCKELRAASQTDMLEDNPHPLPIAEGRSTDIDLEFKAFEIKTIRVKLM